MTANLRAMHLHEPISAHIRHDYSSLRQEMTVDEALAAIRQHGVGERIVYFYVVDEADRLVGVVPTRSPAHGRARQAFVRSHDRAGGRHPRHGHRIRGL